MICKYEIISPIPIKSKPFYNNRHELVIPNIKHGYKWFVVVARNNSYTKEREYFILFSTIKFDEQCRRTYTDNSGRFCVYIDGELKDYIDKETNIRGNIDIQYIESENEYDVWQIL